MIDRNDEQMIRSPDRWPDWPWLPMKTRPAEGKKQELGIIIAVENRVRWPAEPVAPVIIHMNLWMAKQSSEDLETIFKMTPKTEFGSVAELLAAGWIVD